MKITKRTEAKVMEIFEKLKRVAPIPHKPGQPDNMDVLAFNKMPEVMAVIENLKEIGFLHTKSLFDAGFIVAGMILRY